MANEATHSSLSHCKTMVLDISHATLAYSILENSRPWSSEDEDKERDLKIGPRGQQHWL